MNKPDLLKFETTAERSTLTRNIQRWLWNTFANIHLMTEGVDVPRIISESPDERDAHKLLQAVIRQIRDVPGADPAKQTLVVLAAGPSLRQYEEHLPWVFEHCYTIASPTVLPYLGMRGLTPDVVLAVDAHPVLADHTRRSGAVEAGAHLVCCPEVAPQLPQLFGRDRTHWFRTAIPGPDGDLDWHPYSVFMTFLMSAVQVRIAQLGCVTNMACALGYALRAYADWQWQRIVLLGADYAFVGDEVRVPTHKDGISQAHRDADLTDRLVYDGPGKSQTGELQTNSRMVRYKASLLAFWMQMNAPVYTMSHGILTEFPRQTIEGLMQNEWPEYPAEYTLRQRGTNYLAWFQVWSRKRELVGRLAKVRLALEEKGWKPRETSRRAQEIEEVKRQIDAAQTKQQLGELEKAVEQIESGADRKFSVIQPASGEDIHRVNATRSRR